MRRTIGKFCVVICCIIMYLQIFEINSNNVALLLLGLVLSNIDVIIEALFQHLFNKELGRLTQEIIYAIIPLISLLVPQLIFFIAPLVMSAFREKVQVVDVLSIVALIYGIIYFKSPILLMNLLIAVMGVVIEFLAVTNVEFDRTLKKERDLAKEYEIVLEEKNKMLLENQDNEIYTATLRERNRIAREIHDNVGHMLTRSILQIGAIKVINQDEKLAKPLSDLHDTLNLAMNNIRSSVHDLHDESVDLKTALSDILTSIPNFETKLEYDSNGIISKEVKYALVAIVKEACNNAIKYSNGDKLLVSLMEQPGFYQLIIYDNGTSAGVDVTSGIGLTNMRDRVRSINGNMRIDTKDGFKIIITIMK